MYSLRPRRRQRALSEMYYSDDERRSGSSSSYSSCESVDEIVERFRQRMRGEFRTHYGHVAAHRKLPDSSHSLVVVPQICGNSSPSSANYLLTNSYWGNLWGNMFRKK
ncbi:hypothetical protein Y032_0037g3421 [Ancylostoma ceylanicum]|uniref:Uncharacterized protein n=1 Tax=Ancylostoma ceylanicum TaxID=53326 RepID=A0A016UK23_9BILA|nr:hypothetical protein Y032_0037g3421 [Ancylostoma ceylanicum]